MKRIKAVLFDCDGTLVDSEFSHYLAWKHAMQEVGCDLTLEEYYACAGKPNDVIAKMLGRKIGKNPHALNHAKIEQFEELCRKGIPSIEPTVHFLRHLASVKEVWDLKIGVCSAASKGEILIHLHNLGVDQLLDIVLSGKEDLKEYSDPEGVNKPKPYIYQHAMKQLGVSPRETVVIEDSSTGVEASVTAGCFTIAIPNHYTKNHDLSKADLCVDSFTNMKVDRLLKIVDSRSE